MVLRVRERKFECVVSPWTTVLHAFVHPVFQTLSIYEIWSCAANSTVFKALMCYFKAPFGLQTRSLSLGLEKPLPFPLQITLVGILLHTTGVGV